MNPFDMAILVILGYCVIRGVFRGLIREVTSIAGLAAGFYVAYAYHSRASLFFSKWITEPAYLKITSFLILFCSIFFMITLMGIMIRFVIKLVLLGVVDRIFGGVFGAMKAVLLVSFAYILLITFLPAGGVSVVTESNLAPQINTLAQVMIQVVPKDIRAAYRKKIAEIQKDWQPKT